MTDRQKGSTTGAHDGKGRSVQQDDANKKEQKKIAKAMADNKSFRQKVLAARDGQAPAGGETAAAGTAGDAGSAGQNPPNTAVQGQPGASGWPQRLYHPSPHTRPHRSLTLVELQAL